MTNSLLVKAMADSKEDKFLIDGFPRNEENRSSFEAQVWLSIESIFPGRFFSSMMF